MIDTSDWKPFKIGNLFQLMTGKVSSTDVLTEGDDVYYCGAKKNENGIISKCAYDEKLVSKGNCIVFICDGQGAIGYNNYMDKDFIATVNLVLGYNPNLNKYNAMFLVSVLDLERPKFSFGRKRKRVLPNTVIKLPAQKNSDGKYTPDWQFMEGYIKGEYNKIEEKTITQIKTKPNSLDTSNWKQFKISNLFNVELSKGDLKIDDCVVGNIPLISSGEINNGCVGLIDAEGDGKAAIFTPNKITVDMFCNAFYQDHSFFAVSHGRVNILTPKFLMNKYVALFVTTLINCEKFRFTYGRAVYSNVISNLAIKLPANSQGTPDWQFMEDYIKSLPYSDLI